MSSQIKTGLTPRSVAGVLTLTLLAMALAISASTSALGAGGLRTRGPAAQQTLGSGPVDTGYGFGTSGYGSAGYGHPGRMSGGYGGHGTMMSSGDRVAYSGMGAAMILAVLLGVLILAAAMTSMVVLVRRRANVVDPRGARPARPGARSRARSS